MARAMKDSGIPWIGLVPEHWKVLPLKTSIRWKSEKQHPDAQVLSLYRDHGIVPKDSRDDNFNVTSLDTSGYKYVEVGDLVVNKMKAWQGSIAVSNFEGIVSPAYHVCKITNDQISRKFLHYLLRNSSYMPEYMRLSTGLRIGQWDLGYDDFKNIPIVVPDYSEQHCIAEFLDRKCAEIDVVISQTQRTIEEYKALKQSIITEAVTKGIRGDRPMKDSGIEWIGEIPEDWERDKVVRVFRTIGSGTTPRSDDDTLFEGNINWIQSGDINGGFLLESSNHISEKTLSKYSALKVYKAPFIIMAMYGASIGNTSISKIDGCVNQACCVLLNTGMHFRFTYYVLKSAKDYLVRKADGGGQPNISQDKIKQLWIPVPPENEQAEITAYLDRKSEEIDDLISSKVSLLSELESYKKSVIYEYVTGKKEVVWND